MILLKITGINGMDLHNYSQGGIIAILSVVMVFVILLLIILLTELIESLINKSNKPVMESVVHNSSQIEALDLNDKNKVAAALVASIDYRNQVKKNIKVISVREVK